MTLKASSLLKKYKELSEPVKASVWYTVCNVLNKGIALLTTPIFTRVMTEEQYGSFAIFQSWYNIFFIFTSLNVFMNAYNKGLLRYEDDRDRFSSALLGLTTTLTCGWTLLYLISPPFWNGVFDLSGPLMAAMFIELLTAPALQLWAARQRFDYRYRRYVAISLIQVVLSLGLGVTAVLLTDYKLEARVFTDVFAKAIFAGSLFVLLFWRGKTFFHKGYWKYALAFNIPLIPHYLSNYVLNQSDRIMIGRIVGDSQAAYYSVAYTISTVIMLIITAVNNSLTPYIYKKMHSKESGDIKATITPIIILIAALSILTMVFAPEIITVFAGANYADAIYVVPPVAASVFLIFLYSLFSTVEYYHQKTGRIAAATVVAAALNIVLNLIFIPLFGYYAAGYTTLVSYIVLSIAHYIFYCTVIKETGDARMYDERVIVALSAVVLGIMVIMAATYQFVLVRYIFAAALLVLGILLRKRIMDILRSLKRS